MTLFEKILNTYINRYFKIDPVPHHELLFYPNGWLGKGYWTGDRETVEKIRKELKNKYISIFLACFASLGLAVFKTKLVFIPILVGLVGYFWFSLKADKIVDHLPHAGIKMHFIEHVPNHPFIVRILTILIALSLSAYLYYKLFLGQAAYSIILVTLGALTLTYVWISHLWVLYLLNRKSSGRQTQ